MQEIAKVVSSDRVIMSYGFQKRDNERQYAELENANLCKRNEMMFISQLRMTSTCYCFLIPIPDLLNLVEE